MRLIDADALSRDMHHEAFETDSDWQRWDSGLWIRYKMFENALKNAPTIDAVPVVRCGECEYYKESEYIKGNMVCKYHLGHTYHTEADRFCYYGKRRTDEGAV